MSHEERAVLLDVQTILVKVTEFTQNEEQVKIKRNIFSVAFHFDNDAEDAKAFHTTLQNLYGANSKLCPLHTKSSGQIGLWIYELYSEALKAIDDNINDAKQSIVICYYAGHGYNPSGGDELYFVGGKDDDTSPLIYFNKMGILIESALKDAGFEGLLLYVLDTCYAGLATRNTEKFTITYLCATDKYALAKSHSSVDDFSTYGQFTTCLIEILQEASRNRQALSVSLIVEQLTIIYRKETGNLKVLPYYRVKKNGNETKQFGFVPLYSTGVIRHEDKTLSVHMELKVNENLSTEQCQAFARGIVAGGGKMVDVYISKGTHFIFLAPIALSNALQVVAPENIVKIDSGDRKSVV